MGFFKNFLSNLCVFVKNIYLFYLFNQVSIFSSALNNKLNFGNFLESIRSLTASWDVLCVYACVRNSNITVYLGSLQLGKILFYNSSITYLRLCFYIQVKAKIFKVISSYKALRYNTKITKGNSYFKIYKHNALSVRFTFF